jgi:hypothetical protein
MLHKEKLSNLTLSAMLLHDFHPSSPEDIESGQSKHAQFQFHHLFFFVIGKIVHIQLIMIPPVDW